MDPSSNISTEEVIAKLKDDGDFDRLRLKIIRKLKENEELRNNIISAVKQSATLNRAGAENLKPRQLSDAIHEEIGNKVMGQISDGVWEVIRSSDGMKTEIRETVESVYDRLLNPKGKEVNASSSPNNKEHTCPKGKEVNALSSPDNKEPMGPKEKEVNALSSPNNKEPMGDKEASDNSSLAISACEGEDMLPGNETKEPPGFSPRNYQQANNSQSEHKEETQLLTPHDRGHGEELKKEFHHQEDVSPPNNDLIVPPGFAASVDCEQACDGSDEDPDVPPGFG